MELPKERVIQLPRKLLEQCNGFSFDFGGSVVKICYLAKSDWENGCPGESEGPLRLRSFSREQLEESLEFIKNNAHIRRTHQNPKPIMYTTGIGGFQYGKLVEEKLDVIIENIGEGDGFALTIQSLVETKPLEEFCVPFDEEEAVAVRVEGSNFVKVFSEGIEKGHMQAVMNPTGKEELKKDYDRTSDLSTYCLGMFGSAWGCFKIGGYEDKRYSMSGFTTLGGRSFLGLGCLLTGAKNYGELIALAEKGSNLNLDQTEGDIAERTAQSKDSSEGDMYSDWSKSELTNRPIFNWGKAVGKNLSDFSREDVARTLLQTFCHYLAVTAYDAMTTAQVKHMFVAGSFCNHPLIQKVVLNEFENRKWIYAGMVHGMTADYHLHFLQYGSHFGAIGAILKGAEMNKKDDSSETSK